MNKKIIIGVIVLVIVVVGAWVLVKKNKDRVPESVITSYSSGTQVLEATFDNKSDTVTFTEGSVGTVTLPRAISASGARYASEDESVVFWEHQGGVTITKGGDSVFEGSVIETRTPSSDEKLTSSTWIWEKTVKGDDSVVTPKKEGVFTVKFGTDGRVSGTTDCNGFGGTYKTDSKKKLEFSQFMSTLMFCEGSQEQEFTSSIMEVDHYVFKDNGHLVLNMKLDYGEIHFVKKQ